MDVDVTVALACGSCGHKPAIHTERGCTLCITGVGLLPFRRCPCTRTQAESLRPGAHTSKSASSLPIRDEWTRYDD